LRLAIALGTSATTVGWAPASGRERGRQYGRPWIARLRRQGSRRGRLPDKEPWDSVQI